VIDILEFSGIAWPNPGMWAQAQSCSVHVSVSDAQRPFVPEIKAEEDAHAHSPRRPCDQNGCIPKGLHSRRHPDHEDYWANQSVRPPQHRLSTVSWNQISHGESNVVRQNGLPPDPFLEPRGLDAVASRRGKMRSSEDTPMPDVSSHEPSRNISGMTGISYEHKDGPSNNIATHEAIMNQLVEALSPLKSGDDGPHNTTNTPSSEIVFSKPSAAPKGRAASCDVAGTRLSSPVLEKKEKITETSRKASTKIVSANPAGPVQSKKEGDDNKENTPDTRVAGADFTRQSSLGSSVHGTKSTENLVRSSDSKRKRPLEEASTPLHQNCTDDSVSSSPSKKVSKMTSAEVSLRGQSPHTPVGGMDVREGLSLKMGIGRE
jgi:hypothetical protein